MIFAAATATQASANDHFQITLLVLGGGLAAIGWIIKHALAQSETRHIRVDRELSDTHEDVDHLCERVVALETTVNRRRWFRA